MANAVDQLLATASLKNPDICAHPNAYYAAMRAQDPVHFDEKLGVWLVSRYEDLQTVFRDPITFSMKHGYESTYAKGFIDEFKQILERDGGGFFPDAIMSDPPEHTRVRRLMDKAFTVHGSNSWSLESLRVVVNMIEALADKGHCEFVKEFAQPMTIAIICEQLGLDHFDAHKIERWSQAVVQQISHMQTHERMVENAQQICELQNYLIARIREREAEPREDMISDLVHAVTEDGTKLTFKETVSLVRAMLIAGNVNLAFPTAEIAVMGPEGAVNILYRRELGETADAARFRAERVAEFREKFANPYVAAERGYVDDVIEPRETRRRLCAALEILRTKRDQNPPRKHGNLPL